MQSFEVKPDIQGNVGDVLYWICFWKIESVRMLKEHQLTDIIDSWRKRNPRALTKIVEEY